MRQQHTKATVPLDVVPVRSSVSCGGAYLTIAYALLRADANWHKIHDIHACAFGVQTK